MMRSRVRRVPAVSLAALLAAAVVASGATPGPPAARPLPPIVFVSRWWLAQDPDAYPPEVPPAPGDVPGLGPHLRASRAPGRLLLRAPDGSVRELAGPDRFAAIAHPSVSPDGRHLVFAAIRDRQDPWRIWRYDFDHERIAGPLDEDLNLHPGDRVQPCWVSDSVICAVWIEGATRTQYTDLPVTRLVLMDALLGVPDNRMPGRRVMAGGASPPETRIIVSRIVPITTERNGAETPVLDPTTGRILYSRWWYNRWRASDDDPRGITSDPARAIARDTVNLWQLVSIRPDGGDERLEASGLTTRLGSMGYGPAVLADGSIVATYGGNLGLSPGAGTLGIQRFAPRLGGARRLAGALVDATGGSGYGSPRGLAAPAACAPAALPDGRILFSYDPGARGGFGLYAMDRDGSRIEPVFDAPGTLELDAAPVLAWSAPRRVTLPEEPAPAPRVAAQLETRDTFRFFDRDVFAGGRARPGVHAAPPRTAGARIRFWTTLPAAAEAGGDTAVLVREAAVGAEGTVDVEVPAGVPLFEQLVDAHGRVLRSADGPAHVAGYNAGPPGATVACVGCHTGHSVLERGRIRPPRRTR